MTGSLIIIGAINCTLPANYRIVLNTVPTNLVILGFVAAIVFVIDGLSIFLTHFQ